MNDLNNGSSFTPPPNPGKGMQGRIIVDQAKGVFIVVARGMFSLLAALQYEGVLICMAQAIGEMLAEACWCDNIAHSVHLRSKVKHAFEHGMKLVPAVSPQPAQMPQSTETRQ